MLRVDIKRSASFMVKRSLWILPLFGFVSGSGTAGEAPQAGVDLSRGQQVYERFCALCHGSRLEGQANWRQRGADGKLPAPPHDETGHTWHHPDDVLFEITKFGMVPPNAPTDYASDMPAWGGTLSDADIWNVLGYIKSQWPQRQRDYQVEITQRARNQSTQ